MTDRKPVRWGILGAANFARTVMGPAIHMAEDAVLAAVASSSEDKIAPLKALAPGLRYHPSYDALLADPEIDAVYVPLPNHLHVEWAVKAMRAGKAVLCEKPITMSETDFDTLIAVRDETGMLVSEAFMIVHHPQWDRVRELLDREAIGKLKLVNASFTYDNPDMGNIRNNADSGGGGLRDIGVYTFGATRIATGAEPVAMPHARVERENGVDTYSANVFDFGEFELHSVVSTRMADRQEVSFHGTGGRIVVKCPFTPLKVAQAELRIVPDGGPETIEVFSLPNQYVIQVERFGAALREGASWPWPLESARGTQRMIDMALAAD